MPIYEYFSPQTNKIYQFYAKTLAQGETTPKCPDGARFKMIKIPSCFAIGSGETSIEEAKPTPSPTDEPTADSAEETNPRIEAAMDEIARDIDSIDENDPRAMARMIRKMADASGEPFDEQTEEVVRKLEEGTDPEKLESEMGDAFADEASEERSSSYGNFSKHRPTRDPNLYDY